MCMGYYTKFGYYFNKKTQKNEISDLHKFTLSFGHIMVDNLINQVKESEIIKIIPVTKTNQERKVVGQILLADHFLM